MSTEEQAREAVATANDSAYHKRAEHLVSMITSRYDDIEDVVGKNITAKKFSILLLSAFRKNSKLADCTDSSIINCLIDCAAMGLEPNTQAGEAYLIPRSNRRINKIECTLQVGYQGWLKILYATEKIRDVCAKEVYANDEFAYIEGLERSLTHRVTATGDRGAVIGCYAVIRTKDEGTYIEYMNEEELKNIEDRSSSVGDSPWKTDRAMMMRKTVLKRCMKYMPRFTTALLTGLEADDNIVNIDSNGSEVASDE